ncbi:hypothetical protein [Mycolicibacterium vaccae]|uniref:hypothetical protein n=1 Tax=Mycolicibacterium vaccae TaxID=1810 RepID=UPI003D00BE5D
MIDLSGPAGTVAPSRLLKGERVREDWIAARRLASTFHSGSVDNFISVVGEIDREERWKAVAVALVGELCGLAQQAHGPAAQRHFDQRLALLLDGRDKRG